MTFNSTKKECKANKREGENPNFILLHLNPSYPQTTVCFMPLSFSLSAHHAAVFMSLSFSPYCLENAFSRNWKQRHEGEGSTSHLYICPSYSIIITISNMFSYPFHIPLFLLLWTCSRIFVSTQSFKLHLMESAWTSDIFMIENWLHPG